MSILDQTVTAACAMCGLTPGGPGITGDRGDDSAPGYYLCLDRAACLERAIAAQEAARDAARGESPAAEAEAEVPQCDCQQDPAEPEAPVQAPEGQGVTWEQVAPRPCPATSPTRFRNCKVLCTLPASHGGDHMAGGTGTPPGTWAEGSVIDWDALDAAQDAAAEPEPPAQVPAGPPAQDPAPGAAQDAAEPAGPPAGEGQPDAAPGAGQQPEGAPDAEAAK